MTDVNNHPTTPTTDRDRCEIWLNGQLVAEATLAHQEASLARQFGLSPVAIMLRKVADDFDKRDARK